MKKYLVAITTLVLVAVLAAGCAEFPSSATGPATTPTGEEVNFRLLISDEANDIGDFASLNVTVSKIGVQEGGGSGNWTNYEIDPPRTVDLTELTGDNATEIFSGYIVPGEYTKVFIYAENVTGLLDGQTVKVKLPSGKLQISKPFTLGDDLLVNFVFDITVIKAGKSGKYILKPQIGESGPNQKFREIKPKGHTERHEEQNGGPEEQEFEGTIEEIIDEDTWKVNISSENWTVDVSGADIEGVPAVGLEAEIEGRIAGNIIVASEVEIKEAEEQEFEGTIEEIIDEDTWKVNISSENWTVDVSGADIEGVPVVGLEVEIEGTVVDEDDNKIVASKVEIKDEE